jgi:hypothetical protein
MGVRMGNAKTVNLTVLIKIVEMMDVVGYAGCVVIMRLVVVVINVSVSEII